MKISKSLEDFVLEDEDENIAVDIVKDAIQYPVIQISNNAGFKWDRVVEQVKADKDLNDGFDASTWEFKDLVKAGIIDPAKVIRVALENAVSTAAMFLTTDAVIVDNPKPECHCNCGQAWAGDMWWMWMY